MIATSAAPLVILTHVCHPAITEGFLPAAHALDLPVWLLTDHRLDHLAYFREHPSHAPQRVIECDVFNPLGVLDVLHDADIAPRAVFSNSDHLQTSTALVAAALGLPGKDWQVCYAAKNKAAMRQRLRAHDCPAHGFARWRRVRRCRHRFHGLWWPNLARAWRAWMCATAPMRRNCRPTWTMYGSAIRSAPCCWKACWKVRCLRWKRWATASACKPSAASRCGCRRHRISSNAKRSGMPTWTHR
ncbi:hypothetical protein XAB3213_3610016 [Xanthomonas citri pv. bilvae]|nr:hypothetical protein XAB3213_3610016 [Xanthomonas citri pv. bilvae]